MNDLMNRVGHAYKFLVTDRDGEYLNDNMEAYYASKGIVHVKYVPRVKSTNGITERTN